MFNESTGVGLVLHGTINERKKIFIQTRVKSLLQIKKSTNQVSKRLPLRLFLFIKYYLFTKQTKNFSKVLLALTKNVFYNYYTAVKKPQDIYMKMVPNVPRLEMHWILIRKTSSYYHILPHISLL